MTIRKKIKDIIYKNCDEVVFDSMEKSKAELRIDVDLVNDLVNDIINEILRGY